MLSFSLYNRYMNEIYGSLIFATLLPVLATILFVLINKIKFVDKIPYGVKQAIYGITFGLIAVWGTENGIPYNGAVINVRDGAVLTAGLVFGGPAGIIAGLIGGIERYFAVYWGVGAYTQIACSISTTFAGFLGAILRKQMFSDETPGVGMSLAVGIVMEVIHLSMVFLTNMSDVERAMTIVKTCSLPMIPTNGLAVMISVIVANFFGENEKDDSVLKTISDTIQVGLLIAVGVIFVITTTFNYEMQSRITDEQIQSQLVQGIKDLSADIEDASGEHLIEITKEIAPRVNEDINELAEKYGVREINFIDFYGVIYKSTNPEYVGFDINTDERAAEFICLVSGEAEYSQEYGPSAYNPSISRKYVGVRNLGGCVQVGYDAEQFQDDIAEKVTNAANNKHIGTTGYVLIADKDLNIVGSPYEHRHKFLTDYGFDVAAPADTLNDGFIDGEEAKFIYTEAEGYYVISVIPSEEAYKVRSVATYVNVFMEIMAFALLFVMIYNLIKIVVVANINKTNTSLARIIDGDLDEVVEVNDTKEFAELSYDINQTVDKLKTFIADAKARIDAEIQYAKNIQESALPHAFPNDNKYEIFALMEAAKGVGGDFYDFYKTTRHGVNFMIADVSGKGIPGAMFMMRAKAELHTLTETGIPVNEVFTYGNERLCEGNDAGMFVTAWEGNINLETGQVRFANAGHNPPVIMRTDGTVEYIRGKAGFVLAGMEGVKYQLQELQMNEGDVIFLYTDGVVEATNKDNELYGEDRLIECLKKIDIKTVGMDYLCCEVIGDVGMFVGEAEQFDDITMLALKYKGNHENEDHSLSKTNMYTLDGKQKI